VARAAPVEWPREIRGARGHDRAAKFLADAIAEETLLASKRSGRLKVPVRKMLQFFLAAVDADVLF
jgi:hypothetical protein